MAKTGKKKTVAAVLSMVLALSIGAGVGVSAYLSDKEEVKNTIVIGNVKIDLKETGYPGNTSSSVKNLSPFQEVTKNPSVWNTGENDTVVFMVLDSPMEAVSLLGENGQPKHPQAVQATSESAVTPIYPEATVEELFYFKKSNVPAKTHETAFDKNWMLLDAKSMYIAVDKSGNEFQIAFTEDGNPLTNDDLSDTVSAGNFENAQAMNTLAFWQAVAAKEGKFDFADWASGYPNNVALWPYAGATQITKRQLALQQAYWRSYFNPSTGVNRHLGNNLDVTTYSLWNQDGSPQYKIYRRYVLAYKTDLQGSTLYDDDAVRASAKLTGAPSASKTSTLFDKVQMKSFLENQIGNEAQDIRVRAYAIQADDIIIDGTTPSNLFTKNTLSKIYDIYIHQNSLSVDEDDRNYAKLQPLTDKGMMVVDIRDANSTAKTVNGESERKNDGTFEGPTEEHKNLKSNN